jgi:pyruvate formate lyase activating enzyme
VRGLVFNLQDYAVHDGPGIRTLVFLKGCPLRCAWCCNPESQNQLPELRHLGSRCRACFRCVQACPNHAARRMTDAPLFDRALCATCLEHACVDACCHDALSVTGELIDAGDVVAQVARNEAFFRNSGGGVTFSGGEPFFQAPFLLEALALCREKGIATAVETCGYARPADLLAAEPLVDLFLFDVKLVDPEEHRRATGSSNELILANLRRLAERAPGRVIIRVPLIPGYTDSFRNLRAIASLAVELGVAEVDLEPYHAMGCAKYTQTGRPAPPELELPGDEEWAAAAALFTARGLRCELP